MQKVLVWLLDKLLIISLAILLLAFGLIVYDLINSNGGDQLGFFMLKHFDSKIFSLDQDYIQSPTENNFYVYPQAIYFSAFGDFGTLFTFLLKLIPIGLFAFIIWSLWGFVYEIRKANFFTSNNVKALNRVGVSLILLEVIEWFNQLIGSYYFRKIVLGEQSARFSVNFLPDLGSYVVIGFLVLLIATAFKEGLKLKEDQELTI